MNPLHCEVPNFSKETKARESLSRARNSNTRNGEADCVGAEGESGEGKSQGDAVHGQRVIEKLQSMRTLEEIP